MCCHVAMVMIGFHGDEIALRHEHSTSTAEELCASPEID